MIGLFFGSFNPIHVGHLILANYMLSFHDIDELWFVISPHNPLKNKKTLLDEKQRLNMVNAAIDEMRDEAERVIISRRKKYTDMVVGFDMVNEEDFTPEIDEFLP
jgi:cytidyltransferase-like protein